MSCNYPFLGKNAIWAVRTNDGKTGKTHPVHIVLRRMDDRVMILNFACSEAFELATFLAKVPDFTGSDRHIAKSQNASCLVKWVRQHDRDCLQIWDACGSGCEMLAATAKNFSDRILRLCGRTHLVTKDPTADGTRRRLDENLRSVFG